MRGEALVRLEGIDKMKCGHTQRMRRSCEGTNTSHCVCGPISRMVMLMRSSGFVFGNECQ